METETAKVRISSVGLRMEYGLSELFIAFCQHGHFFLALLSKVPCLFFISLELQALL